MVNNALTIDIEDWFHPELIRDHVDLKRVEGRVSKSISLVLSLLNKYQVKVTFFVVGEVARKSPELIRQLYREGHEIGCHGMSHRMLKDLGEEGFKNELKEFQDLMREILGDVQIKGFRAPTFSLNTESKWALPILRDFGYEYDSSLFPTKIFLNRIYGIKKAPRFPYRISFDDPSKEDPDSPLWEFPPAMGEVLGIRIPLSGGFYLRAIPFFFFRIGLKTINQEGPFTIYLHPWEWDQETPKVPLSFFSKLVTYYGMKDLLSKLEELLRTFSFSRMDKVLQDLAIQGGRVGSTNTHSNSSIQ